MAQYKQGFDSDLEKKRAAEAEAAARDAEAIKAVEEADRTDWHPPYELIEDK